VQPLPRPAPADSVLRAATRPRTPAPDRLADGTRSSALSATTLRATVGSARWSSSPPRARADIVSVLTPAEILIAARRLAGARPHLAAVAGIVHHKDLWRLCLDELTGYLKPQRAANSGPSLLMQGQAHRAEPRADNPDPFPPIRRLGGCRDVSQSSVQLGQLEASLGPGVKVPAGGGFVQQPFGFAVVIWAVHSLSSVVVPGRPSPGPWRLTLTMNAIRQATVQPSRLRASYVIVALRPIAGHGATGDRREPQPGRSGCHRGPRSTSRSAPRARSRAHG